MSGTFHADASGNVRGISGIRILAEVSSVMRLGPSMLMLVGTFKARGNLSLLKLLEPSMLSGWER